MAPNDPQGSDTAGTAPETIACAFCKKLVPASAAVSPEGHDYVFYFCGAQCHAEWEREKALELEQEFEARSGVKRS